MSYFHSMRPVVFFLLILCGVNAYGDEAEARKLLVELITSKGDQQDEAMQGLRSQSDPIIGEVYEAWRGGKIQLHSVEGSNAPQVLLEFDRTYSEVLTGKSVVPSGELKTSRANRKLRKTFKRLVDILDLNSSDFVKRIQAAEKLGMSQKEEYLPDLIEKLELQTDEKVKDAFQEAVYISQLKNGTHAERISAVTGLGNMKSYPSRDFITALGDSYEGTDEEKSEMSSVITAALVKIDSHQKFVERIATVVRGLSTGSVLLLVAYGLAITFGQMGVINMSHGEFIAIGGYTTYFVQKMFAEQFGEESASFGWYFVVSLPLAFIMSALVGVILERGLIRFLYNRPLESLLATWGVSMILQQLFRLKISANNVSVSSPQWLSGNYEMMGVSLSSSRIFMVGFAVVVIVVTWILMNKTNWGLYVRATMQNRKMASALGVPSGRVNMMTFAFGSGLAGLAGAFISQIGTVGPEMGNTYIVDSFMVVVVGGVGNLFGAALSSMGIGMVDQILQPILGPVMGKISVLFGIILFLQFKPGGIFPARSRSLDD